MEIRRPERAQVRELSAPPKVPSSGEAKPIPHPIGPTTDCKICHGPDKVKPYPENHTAFTPEMCVTCHQTTLKEGRHAPSVAPPIPHPLTGMGECQTCHGSGSCQTRARQPRSLHARHVQQLP